MDLYVTKSRWKIYLLAVAFIIVAFSLLYTNNVARRLAEAEQKRAEQWAGAMIELFKLPPPACLDVDPRCLDINTEYFFSISQNNKTIPAILTDARGNIEYYTNLDDEERAEKDTAYLRAELNAMAAQHQPIKLETSYDVKYMYYKNSTLLTLLIYFPYFQLVLIAVFLMVAYIGFSSARRAEQNRVWVGLAKETAHQLGTPITAIVGWVENLDLMIEDEASRGMLKELRKDVGRLELVAERFSKIGAIPELTETDLKEALVKSVNYMKKRAPRKVTIEMENIELTGPVIAKINLNLFDWVIENLIKNALDALEGKGHIRVNLIEDAKFIYIDVADTGKGIPSSKFKTVFKPGFSTKKRGWGLGLSLTQRIIKNYHNGRVFVKESELGKGTTFRIELPRD